MTKIHSPTLFSRFSTALLMTSFITLSACGPASEITLPDDPTEEQVVETPDNDKAEIETPDVGSSERSIILSAYSFVDPQHVVPYQALSDALIYFDKNKSKFANQNYISVINFAQSSKEKRFYIISMKTGEVWAIHVAHGKGSDSDHDGYPEKFSNVSGSNASSLGAYRAAETYSGSHGLSMRLDGLSSTNSNARARAIVLHPADYVKESSVIQGRSWGCPAVAPENRDAVLKYLKGGSLMWAVSDKGGTERPAEDETDDGVTTPTTPYNMIPLSWETPSHPERTAWSQYLMTILMNDWNNLLKGADDMKDFCPNYNTLSTQERANVWAQLIAAITKFESGYDPLSRMHETTMGTDPVTKQPVYSEGLLQLSYQDISSRSYCKFDWSQDKNLSAKDPKKTILDPYRNLYCGVGIMAGQVARKGAIKLSTGVYWSVIKNGGKYQKISSITSMVKSLSICQ